MTVGLRTSWLQYPVETITSPRCIKYGIPYRTPKYTSQNSSLSRNYLQITWRIFTIIRLISKIKKQTSPKIDSSALIFARVLTDNITKKSLTVAFCPFFR